ncbi:signal peptidase II [Cohnella terricola]|uniref:Lipoprotein signal peptidase n=1 Tax=Cohnella terricola TaxID=1289167 RepID=A0A559JL47_9BACL|nr:signal peptidase II [Cohnella terricola]TVY00601.1 signal peptidase II [Cohnella terricola]
MQRRIWPIWAYYAIAIVVLLIDYASKKVISRNVELNTESISVLGNFFLITHTRNRGAAFSMLQDQRWFFLVVTIAVVTGILWYLHRSFRTSRLLLLLALAVILGGAVGNFLDRALYGEVVDFLQFNFGSYTFPIFNLADTAICVGVGMVILDTLLTMKQENKSNGNGEQPRDASQEQHSV